LALSLLIILSFSGVRLLQYQIVDGEELLEAATSSTTSTRTLEAARGDIVDRYGRVLATTKTEYQAVFDYTFTDKDKLNASIDKLITIFEAQGAEWVNVTPIESRGSGYAFTSDNTMKEAFKPYLNYIQDCNASSSSGKCWHAASKFFALDGQPSALTGWSNSYPGLVLNNGILLIFGSISLNCSTVINTTGYSRCGEINVDVNGFKGPNALGKDIFQIHILENRTLPRGISRDWNVGCTNGDGTGGLGCGAQYLYN
jgi:hypothetical protein